MNTCRSTSIKISKCQRSAIHVSGHIEGCRRMLETNEKLLRILKSEHHVSHKQVSLIMETMAFIVKEVAQDFDELDRLADMIIDIMEKEDGHCALSMIPAVKEIKDDCNALMFRLKEHRKNITVYERNVKRSRRGIVLDKKKKAVPVS